MIKDSMTMNQMVVLTVGQVNDIINEAAERAVEKFRDSMSQSVMAETKKLSADEDRFLTRQEASKMFHVDTTTLWRWENEGLPAYKAGARRVLYKLSDLLTMTKQKGKHNKSMKGSADNQLESHG